MMIAAIKSDKAGFGDEQASYTQEQADYEEDQRRQLAKLEEELDQH